MDAGIYECYADNMYNVDTRTFKTDFSITFDWIEIIIVIESLVKGQTK